MASYRQSANIANVFDQFMDNPQLSADELTELCNSQKVEVEVSLDDSNLLERDDGYSR